ncbi:type IV secretory system conjugative DNA transfer family protein [Zavarzinella formosa]|uniref:type IV secretory system conjugative DNA transfer family protein n=1 Tax=Zavarzinella formosa TaxID=360055 RepID=UPI0012F8708B|nr:TraM recognition domain-containing protein [Zavarzinella formosa]
MWRRFRGRPRPPPPLFDPHFPILDLGDREFITLGQMLESLVCFGATGSGKTSGPAFHLLLNIIRAGCSVLVLTVKPDECQRVKRICEIAGRGSDFRRIGEGEPWKLDLLDYELSQPHASVESAAAMLDTLVELASRSQGKNEEPFWQLLCKRLLRMSIAAVWLGTGKCSITDVYRFVADLPQSPDQLQNPEWIRDSFAGQCYLAGTVRDLPPGKRRVFELSVGFCEEWSNLSEKTRSIGHTMAVNILSQFMTGPVADVCASGESNLTPDEAMTEGLVVCVDFPVLLWREPGQYLQQAIKSTFTRAALRRDVTKSPRGWCLFVDEANWFADARNDALFASVSRSARAFSCVFAQNIPLLQQSFGEEGEQAVASWLGNFNTTLLCSNGSHQTNTYFSDKIGQRRELFLGGSTQRTDEPPSLFSVLASTVTGSFSEQWSPIVPPHVFATQLRTGGVRNGKLVDFFVIQSARMFGGLPFKLATLRQGDL